MPGYRDRQSSRDVTPHSSAPPTPIMGQKAASRGLSLDNVMTSRAANVGGGAAQQSTTASPDSTLSYHSNHSTPLPARSYHSASNAAATSVAPIHDPHQGRHAQQSSHAPMQSVMVTSPSSQRPHSITSKILTYYVACWRFQFCGFRLLFACFASCISALNFKHFDFDTIDYDLVHASMLDIRFIGKCK